jgi:hypothetical protein
VYFPQFPRLSEEDKFETSEGGLDPLGLVQVAEALAIRLVPGVRERMSHPRYLTAMAVAMEVCRKACISKSMPDTPKLSPSESRFQRPSLLNSPFGWR